MAGFHVGDFESPDEVRTPDKTKVDVVRMGDATTAARLTLQPGWQWSECIKPVAGTDTCQVRHRGGVGCASPLRAARPAPKRRGRPS